jgi:hypothetical protein
MELNVKKIHNTPYKLVLSNQKVVGLFERRDHKEMYVSKGSFSDGHKKLVELAHGKV